MRVEAIIGAMLQSQDFSNTSGLRGNMQELAKLCREQVIKTGDISFLDLYQAIKDKGLKIPMSYLVGCTSIYNKEQTATNTAELPCNKYFRENKVLC